MKDKQVCSEQTEHVHNLRATEQNFVSCIKDDLVEQYVMHFQTNRTNLYAAVIRPRMSAYWRLVLQLKQRWSCECNIPDATDRQKYAKISILHISYKSNHIPKPGIPSKGILEVRIHIQHFLHILNYYIYTSGVCVNFVYYFAYSLYLTLSMGVQVQNLLNM
jgi:hypothetical protein